MKYPANLRPALRDALKPLDTPERRALYAAGQFPRADRCGNLAMRYRWDLLHAVPDHFARFIGPAYAARCDDSHIDTALRSIVPALERSPAFPAPTVGKATP